MSDFLSTMLRTDLPPHGHCYLWDDNLVNLHVASDAIIVLSYLTIPFALIYLVFKRDDLRFNYIFVMFAVFIFACGITHLTNIYNVWNGAYWISGGIKAITAAASLGTAILVWPLIPKALALPSNETLRLVNMELQEKSDLATQQRIDLEELSANLAAMVEDRNRELAELRDVKSDLEKSNAALELSNDALQQFAYIASHDLKEPLRTIKSFGQLLQRSAKDTLSEKDNELVNFMTDAASRMTALLDSLRSYTVLGVSSDSPVPVDLTAACQDTVADLASAIETSKATVNITPIGSALAKQNQIQPLIQNLISNAIKFKAEDRDPVIDIGPLQGDDPSSVGFYVRDNGIGIDPQFHERIFGVFERLHGHTQYTGTGIGLAIAKKIVEANRGTIAVVSTPDEGAEFRIWLPRAEDVLEA